MTRKTTKPKPDVPSLDGLGQQWSVGGIKAVPPLTQQSYIKFSQVCYNWVCPVLKHFPGARNISPSSVISVEEIEKRGKKQGFWFATFVWYLYHFIPSLLNLLSIDLSDMTWNDLKTNKRIKNPPHLPLFPRDINFLLPSFFLFTLYKR